MTKAAAIRAVKGFRDVLPDESRRWQAIEDAAVATFVRYGFGEIRLPILERTELFARSSRLPRQTGPACPSRTQPSGSTIPSALLEPLDSPSVLGVRETAMTSSMFLSGS